VSKLKKLKKNVREKKEIWQSDRHQLFVEGKDENAIDPLVLEILLKDIISVKPMGASYHVESVAKALHKHHPDYYFLIDRDHHHDEPFVEKCWKNFPDPTTHNLLVWYRRELENYFLIPEYLSKSQYLTVSEDELRQRIRGTFQERLYLETANYVIVSLRETLKNEWITLFKPTDFKTKDEAIAKLVNMPAFTEQLNRMGSLFCQEKLKELFEECLDTFTGGNENDTLEFERGQWLELMGGKKVLLSIINSSCFKMKDAQSNSLQGKVKLSEIVKDLVRKPIDEQPNDFQRLHEIISRRILSV
jgi:CRISPR/Cas system CSM-associated protein Csm2 small subunit